MRKRVERYKEITDDLPDIGVIFCGNRAVVTMRRSDTQPKGHREVYYGPFFWWRLKRAMRKVFRKHTGSELSTQRIDKE